MTFSRLLAAALFTAAVASATPDLFAAALPAESAIQAADLQKDITFLASDAMEGRNTAGGKLEGPVTDYLEAEFKKIGLEPGGVTGYRQPWRYAGWGSRDLAGFAAAKGIQAHDHAADLAGTPHVPASEFGARVNEGGLAYGPDGLPTSIEPVDGAPTLASAEPNTHNLIGIVRGSDLTDQWVVIGAHMDHIGKSNWGADKINNGADDNASGSSSLLAVARALAAAKAAGAGPRRNVLLIWFAGEEKGLLGSQYFVGHPTIPLEKVKAMLNVDMTGRLEPDKVSCGDEAPAGMANLFHPMHDVEGLGFKPIAHDIDQYMHRSDQYSFFKHNIPVIFFFEGLTAEGELNPDYHRPSDEVSKIDFDKAARIAKLMFRHVIKAANLN